MIYRIKSVEPLSDFILRIEFDDGYTVLYDVKEDFDLPGYDLLRDVPGLFASVQLDQSRGFLYWNEDVDLPWDILREYGKPIEGDPDFTRLTPAEESTLASAMNDEYISADEIDWNADPIEE